MTEYTKMTLGDLIEALEDLPEGALVRGFSTEIQSYRGYYERNAVEPGEKYIFRAGEAAQLLGHQVGLPITGYKGGDYRVRRDEGIYLATWGDLGPCFCGLEEAVPGVWEPVVVDDGSVW